MALTTSELHRIKYELGYGGLTVSAEPYISYVSLFDQIVQPYLESGASTTSSTAVSAASVATPIAITLASAVGFSAGNTVIVDVDARQEAATVQSIQGNVMTVLLTQVHSGTYPVTVEGAESIIRGILRELVAIATKLSKAAGFAGLKRVEDIEFYPSSGTVSGSVVAELKSLRNYWRDELASALGVVRFGPSQGGSAISTY